MIETVYLASLVNAEYFLTHCTNSNKEFLSEFQRLASKCHEIKPLLTKISLEAPNYDVDAETKGNGYRSFLTIFESLFKKCSSLCESVKKERVHVVQFVQKFIPEGP